MRRALPSIFVSVLLIAGCSGSNDKLVKNEVTPITDARDIKESAFDLEITRVDGSSAKLSELRGKLIILQFWATWCVPCREEMVRMQHVYNQLGDDGLTIAGVAVEDDLQAVANFAKQSGITFPIYSDDTGSIKDSFGVRSVPETLFMNGCQKPFKLSLPGREEAIGISGFYEWDSPAVVRELRAELKRAGECP